MNEVEKKIKPFSSCKRPQNKSSFFWMYIFKNAHKKAKLAGTSTSPSLRPVEVHEPDHCLLHLLTLLQSCK